jgi:hypothetical protein
MTMKTRIGTLDGSTSATVIEAFNHLMQRRQFAWDGRYWFYQPSSREKFRKVNPMDVPDNAVNRMAEATKLTPERLRDTT